MRKQDSSFSLSSEKSRKERKPKATRIIILLHQFNCGIYILIILSEHCSHNIIPWRNTIYEQIRHGDYGRGHECAHSCRLCQSGGAVSSGARRGSADASFRARARARSTHCCVGWSSAATSPPASSSADACTRYWTRVGECWPSRSRWCRSCGAASPT